VTGVCGTVQRENPPLTSFLYGISSSSAAVLRCTGISSNISLHTSFTSHPLFLVRSRIIPHHLLLIHTHTHTHTHIYIYIYIYIYKL
jgi:hypothetical protein